MKKEYKHPHAEVHFITADNILAGSVGTSEGTTSEQNAKETRLGFYDEEDNEE